MTDYSCQNKDVGYDVIGEVVMTKTCLPLSHLHLKRHLCLHFKTVCCSGEYNVFICIYFIIALWIIIILTEGIWCRITKPTVSAENFRYIVKHNKVVFDLDFFFRSNASYRLKHRVDLKDLWVCGFEHNEEEEDEDTDVDLRTSIVLAWSASLCLVAFRWAFWAFLLLLMKNNHVFRT